MGVDSRGSQCDDANRIYPAKGTEAANVALNSNSARYSHDPTSSGDSLNSKSSSTDDTASTNPANGEAFARYPIIDNAGLESKLTAATEAFGS